MCLEIIYSIYMYNKYLVLNDLQRSICIKKDLALNDLQWLICYKTKLNKSYIFDIYVQRGFDIK